MYEEENGEGNKESVMISACVGIERMCACV